MADNSNDQKIQQFMTVTGVDEERAKFYVESSAGHLEVRNYILLYCFFIKKKQTNERKPPHPFFLVFLI